MTTISYSADVVKATGAYDELAALAVRVTETSVKFDRDDPRFFEAAVKHCLPLPSVGLGDTVAKALIKTGIGPVAKKVIQCVTGKPCNCGKRQAALNKVVGYYP